MRVYISADMEGVAGVVTGDQLVPEGFEYEQAREQMTREVVAAVEAVLAAAPMRWWSVTPTATART